MNLTILAFEIIAITLFLTIVNIKAFNAYQSIREAAKHSEKSLLNN